MGNNRTSKKAQSELEHEYETLMKHCGAGVVILDPVGIIQRLNTTAIRLLGLPEERLMGEKLAPPIIPEEFHALVEAARTERVEQRCHLSLPKPKGGVALVSISPILGEKRKQGRFLIIVRDVTELRRLETVRRDFVANVSHEMRTPLASIRAMAETLQDGALEDPSVADRFLGTIVTEAERLARISEDLLILAHAESGSSEKSPFSLSHLLEAVVNRFQSQAQKAGVALTTSTPPDLEIVANADQIEEVIVNLVDNAIKYTHSGGRIQVTAERWGEGVRVQVADTGIGMTRKHLPRIFERFYRVDKARSRQSGGTGLGLSIVKHIVEAHGGQVAVASEPNHGSTFSFMLPYQATESAVNGHQKPQTSHDSESEFESAGPASGDRSYRRRFPPIVSW